MPETKGHCKHGEFVLTEGCPQCIAEREAETNIVKVKYYSETTGKTSDREYSYFSVDQLKLDDHVQVPVRDRVQKAIITAINVPTAEIEPFKKSVKTIPAGAKIEPRAESPPAAEEEVNTKINLCDTCTSRNDYPVCSPSDVEFGDGQGNDNIIKCSKYENGPATPSSVPLNVEIQPEPHETALALRPGEDIEAHGYFEESMKLLEYAEGRVIATVEDIKTANDDLVIIARLKKAMDSKRREYLEPLKAQTEAIRSTYDYLMLPIFEAEKITKAKMNAYDAEQRRIRAEQEEINRLRIEAAQKEMKLNGELTESVDLVEVAPEAPRRVSTDMGSSGMVDHWKYEIVDLKLIPREYMLPDTVLLGNTAKKYQDKKEVPGVRFFNEPYRATRAR